MANSYLSRTPSSAGNRKTFTISMWVKRSSLGVLQKPFSAGAVSGAFTAVEFPADDKPRLVGFDGSQITFDVTADLNARDVNGWYHMVWSVDTTQATANNRVKFYLNGTQITDLATNTQPSQNADLDFNNNVGHNIGRGIYNGAEYFGGYISHIAMVDGQALAPTVFGETDSTSGIWNFKSPSGVTWGTNGFHLKMENSGALGTDSSGNSNTFTVNGNLKQALDTPSNVHATFNVLSNYHANETFSYGNNKIVSPGDRHDFAISTLGMNVNSGKYYAEFKLVAAAGSDHCVVGISDHSYMGSNEELSQENYSIAYVNGGALRSSGTNAATGVGTYTAGDIIGVAVDMDNLKIYWHKNGTYVNSGVPTSGSTGTGAVSIHNIDTSPNSNSRGQGIYFFAAGNWHSGASSTWEANFGNGYFGTTAITSAGSNGNGSLFEYDVPSGYYALNTKNINTYG